MMSGQRLDKSYDVEPHSRSTSTASSIDEDARARTRRRRSMRAEVEATAPVGADAEVEMADADADVDAAQGEEGAAGDPAARTRRALEQLEAKLEDEHAGQLRELLGLLALKEQQLQQMANSKPERMISRSVRRLPTWTAP